MKTLAALAATLAMLSGCEDAEPPAPLVPFGPNWIVVENQRCQMYNPDPDPDPGDTVTWSGACVDGKTSGRGRAVWRYSAGGDDVFKGEHRAGKAHGHGIYIWSGDRFGATSTPVGIPPFVREARDRGDRYEGEWRDGEFHGHGAYTWSDSSHYEGEYRNGRPHGHGVYTEEYGYRYEGEWRDGCFGERDDEWAFIGTTAEACGFE